MTEQWIKGCVVQRIMFRDGLVLSLDAYNELIISVPFHLRLPKIANGDEEVVVVDPKAMKNEERPLFDFAGQTITHADWDRTAACISGSPTAMRSTRVATSGARHGSCTASTTVMRRVCHAARSALCGMTSLRRTTTRTPEFGPHLGEPEQP